MDRPISSPIEEAHPQDQSVPSPVAGTAEDPDSPTAASNRHSPTLILLFDGVCNLCNSSVQFVLRRDKTQRLLFASLQSTAGQQYLQKFGLPTDDLHSFVLIENDKAYSRSMAALRVLWHLGGAWKLLYAFRLLPAFIRDGVYNWVARHRYHWFGKRESCWLPTPELKNRFLSED